MSIGTVWAPDTWDADAWEDNTWENAGDVAPSDLVASVVAGQVVLTWSDTVLDNTGYAVQRATGAGAFAEINTVGDVETDTDAGPFTEDQFYRYKVVVVGGALAGEESNIVQATPNRSYTGGVRSRLRRLHRL